MSRHFFSNLLWYCFWRKYDEFYSVLKITDVTWDQIWYYSMLISSYSYSYFYSFSYSFSYSYSYSYSYSTHTHSLTHTLTLTLTHTHTLTLMVGFQSSSLHLSISSCRSCLRRESNVNRRKRSSWHGYIRSGQYDIASSLLGLSVVMILVSELSSRALTLTLTLTHHLLTQEP